MWRVTLNLNERILKLWRSTRPFGTKVDESNFFTAPEPLGYDFVIGDTIGDADDLAVLVELLYKPIK
jgi:hypothetical protein